MIQCRYQPRRHGGASLLVGGLVVLVAAIYVAVAFEAQVRRVNWAIVTGVCGGVLLFYLLWRWSTNSDSRVEPLDMILDPITRRLSLWRVLIVVAFAIGVWTMGQWVITGHVPTDADKILYLYGTILGSLVAKVASGEWADVKANRQPIAASGTPVPTSVPTGVPAGPVAAEAATEQGQ